MRATHYDIENTTNESKNNEAVVTKDGAVYRPIDPLLVHPYGTPREAWSSIAVLTLVETLLWFVTRSVITLGVKLTVGIAVGWGVGTVPNIGE
jgi:hypothetical protein